MPTIEATILAILKAHLLDLAISLERDTKKNYRQKLHNFLLSDMSQSRVLEMVFTSSFESKTGNMMERCAFEIARLRYGEKAVPSVIRGLGVSDDDVNEYLAKLALKPVKKKRATQVILTRANIKNISEHAWAIVDANAKEKGSTLIGVTQAILKSDIVHRTYQIGTKISIKPIDLFLILPKMKGPKSRVCMEIKAGGNLDTSNAPANVAKLLTLCAITESSEGYFATLYNKNGEGKRFTGTVTKYLADEMILAGSAFWQEVLPTTVTFEDIQKIYSRALKETKILKRIDVLMQNLLPGAGLEGQPTLGI